MRLLGWRTCIHPPLCDSLCRLTQGVDSRPCASLGAPNSGWRTYSLSRVLWAAGIPVGFSQEGLREIGTPGSGQLGMLALAAEATAIFVHAFVLAGRQP